MIHTFSWVLATIFHWGRKYDGYPYTMHLKKVALLVYPYGSRAIDVAYLHDILEDTPMRYLWLKFLFGKITADNVQMVTDEKGANRKERKELTNAKLIKACSYYDAALIVKAADRLANTRYSVLNNNERYIQMYGKEYQSFREAVYRKGLCDEIWSELDSLFEYIKKNYL